MKQRRFRKPIVTLSLFPFLAVLVCTMGALIVLLVGVMQQARMEAAARAAPADVDDAPDLDELQNQLEIHQWRREVLEKQRAELLQQLAERRLTLSHLEDHLRRLETRWRELQQQGQQLNQLGSLRQHDTRSADDELARLRSEIERARRELRQAQEKAAQRPRTFAIVPYDGPNGTKRRPIYIECTDEGIVLQPEGLLLPPQDFEGSLGPGNPLDAALRTTREYLARRGDHRVHGEPYPLLIVRPSGTVAYAVARAAIKSWDDEFGYELVDAETQLEYPTADNALRNELERAVADARSRQVMLAVAMPGRFGRTSVAGLVATTSGGFQAVGGRDREAGGGMTQDRSPGSASRFSSTFRSSNSAQGGGLPDGGPGSLGAASLPGQPKSGTAAGGSSATRSLDPFATSRAAGASTNAAAPGGTPGRTAARGAGGSSTTWSAPGSSTGQNAWATGSPSSFRSGSSGSGAPGDRSFGSGPPGNRGTPGSTGSPGSAGNPGSTGSPGGNGSPSSGGSLGSSANPPAEAMNLTVGNPSTTGQGRSRAKPLAASRGENWGLPQRGSSATAFTRYIPVHCGTDQLAVLPEPGDDRAPVVIAAPGELAEAVDPFVSTIWKRMGSWGIASENGYWKPVLRVQVQPGAEARFEELRTLLQGSGLVVERKP